MVSRLIALLFLSLIISQVPAQDFKDKNYSQLFTEAKIHIANHREKDAVPVLEELYSRDKENSNVAYLLGLCYIKSYKKINKAVKLLEGAVEDYTKFYDRTSVTERGVSEYVYYYLVIGYSLQGDCKKTISTLNEFYRIYSYEDEWFLIDGQKWHRDCGKHKWKEEEDSISTPRDSVLVGDTAQLVQIISTDESEQVDDQSDQKLESTENADNPNKAPTTGSTAYRQQYRDRLKRVGEAGGPEVMTRDVTYTVTTALYGVQVGAYIKPRFSKDFDGLKNVEVYIDNNGVFRYVIGRFAYRSQAEKLLEYVKAEGYGDAFIVDIQGSGNYEEEVVRVNNQSIKREIAGKVDYRVQIGAFKEEVPDDIMRIYLQFDNIKENIQGELTIFTIGTFNNYEITKAYCDNIKENGVPDAFVVAFNQNRKISLEEASNYLAKKKAEELEKAKSQVEETRKKKKKK